MGKLKGLLLLLISVMVLNGCKETPSGNESVSTFTELEVRVDYELGNMFLYGVEVNGKSIYTYTSGRKISQGEWSRFSFTKDDVGGDLTDVFVEITLQTTDYYYTRWDVSTRLDFTLGERRVVRVDCIDYNNGCGRGDLVLTSVE